MGGRRDDDAPARTALPPRPAPPRPTPSAGGQPSVEQPRACGVAEPAGAARRTWPAVGLVLAAAATAAVVLTDDPLVLRIVLLAVCGAFVAAAFLGGSRGSDRVTAAARETELRAAHDLELERQVAARHAHEAELEGRLRREAEEAMRGELRELRTRLGALDRLQEDLAAVSRLRADLDSLAGLSTQLTDLGELRGELAGLAQLRAQLTGVGDLRAELGRLRSEVTEQLSGELLVERIVMRAQSVRGPAQGADSAAVGSRTLAGTPDWPAGPPLRPGGWDVDPWTTTRVETGADDGDPAPWPLASPPVPPAEPTGTSAVVDEEQVSRHRPPPPADRPVGGSLQEPRTEPTPQSPRGWLDQQPPVGAGDPTGGLPVAGEPDRPSPATWPPAPRTSRRHRRAAEPDEDDDLIAWTGSLRGTTEDESCEGAAYVSPSWLDRAAPDDGAPTGSTAWTASDDAGADGDAEAHRAPHRDAPGAPPEPAGHARLEQILAQSGVAAPSGGRSRRRRYREEGQEDGEDVLARVLGRD